jgi:hypothetical protein
MASPRIKHVEEKYVVREAGKDGYLLFYQFERDSSRGVVDFDADVAAGLAVDQAGHAAGKCSVM